MFPSELSEGACQTAARSEEGNLEVDVEECPVRDGW